MVIIITIQREWYHGIFESAGWNVECEEDIGGDSAFASRSTHTTEYFKNELEMSLLTFGAKIKKVSITSMDSRLELLNVGYKT